MDRQDFHPSEVPARPGVYVFRDRFGTVIYVGKARNLRRRMSSYFQPSRSRTADPKLRSLIHSIATWNYETVRTEDEALILESRLIKDYAPHYNVLMRDDKRYLLLKIDRSERFPTLKIARVRKPDGAEYFGPFPQGGALRGTLGFLLSYFGLRGCFDANPNEETRKRCLKRLVHDCCAPCIGKVSEAEYLEKLESAVKILRGGIAPLREVLQQRMKEAAEKCNFEQAAHLRDIMTNLESVFAHPSRNFARPELPDRAPGSSGVASLQQALALPNPPSHIIGFDISNILGTLAVASMVDFKDGEPDRDSYRRFRIKTVFQSDDFAMMAEVVTRHFSRLLREGKPLPDLVMVDGGKGQLSSAIDALVKIKCPALPIIGLAERNEEIYVPGRSDPIVLDRHSAGLRMIQALRDEAHRFAITYHRKLREKALERSLLDDVSGIGEARKQQILREFGSVKAMRGLTAESIKSRVPGMPQSVAQRLSELLARGCAK